MARMLRTKRQRIALVVSALYLLTGTIGLTVNYHQTVIREYDLADDAACGSVPEATPAREQCEQETERGWVRRRIGAPVGAFVITSISLALLWLIFFLGKAAIRSGRATIRWINKGE